MTGSAKKSPDDRATPGSPSRTGAGRSGERLKRLWFKSLKQSFMLAEPPSVWNSALAGLQAALVILIALPLLWLSPWRHLVGFGALGALPALFGRFHPPQERRRIVLQCGVVQTAAVFSMAALVRAGAGENVGENALLLALALSCGFLYFITLTLRPGPPGALIFIFASGAAMIDTPTWAAVFERTSTTAIVSALSWLVCALTERWRQLATPERRFPLDRERSLVDRARVSLRVAFAAAASISLTHALGGSRPEWAAMGSVAVLQGVHLSVKIERAIQRMLGTIIGAAIVWAILREEPSAWVVIWSVALLQFATEVLIGYNYALGQVVLTPMALLMASLASPPGKADASLAIERVISTVIGASFGLILAVIASRVGDRRRRHAPPRRD